MKQSTRVKIRVTCDFDGIKKGSIFLARTYSFCATIIGGEHNGKEIGKSRYKVIKVLEADPC